MTGKELIMYILQNNLEDTVVLENGFFVGFMTETETAVKFGVGTETVRTWYRQKMIEGIKVGDSLYFRKDVVDPRTKIKMGKEVKNNESKAKSKTGGCILYSSSNGRDQLCMWSSSII